MKASNQYNWGAYLTGDGVAGVLVTIFAHIAYSEMNDELFSLWKRHVGEPTKATLVNHVIDSIKTPSLIEIIKLIILVNLYVENSQRLFEDKHANTFFDDFFNRYICEYPIEPLLQYRIDHWDRINRYSQILSIDRQEKLITLMSQRKSDIPQGAEGYTKWNKYIETLESQLEEIKGS